jgi:uncharacterized repeat protein (TIGR01451 family)
MVFRISSCAREKCSSEKCMNTRTRVFSIVVLAGLAAMCGAMPLLAQSPSFSDFSSTAQLTLNGSAGQSGSVLRLAPKPLSETTTQNAGSAWFNLQQPVAGGFSTTFTFRITNTGIETPPGDGIAFVIQNAPTVEIGAPGGLHALGGTGAAIGYGGGFAFPYDGETTTSGIANSLAIEFDTHLDESNSDPNANHVAVQSCGPNSNSADHNATYSPSVDVLIPCKLAIATAPVTLADGNPHTVRIDYAPAVDCVECLPILQVTIDGHAVFGDGVPVDLTSLLNLANPTDTVADSAYVGFTGATGVDVENNDILSWTFTPHGSETIIKTNLPPNVFTTFTFGSYLYKVRPNKGIDQLAVTAVPTDFNAFSPGSNFPTAQCIIYDSTGNKCVEFQAVCTSTTYSPTDPNNPCNSVSYDVVTSYDVPSSESNIVGPGFLKATGQPCPPPVPFDQNIITFFSQTRTDPTTKGTSKPSFSCFVAVQNVTYPPADVDILNLAPFKVKPNSNLTYVSAVIDFGPANAQGVNIRNTIPSGTQYVSSALCSLSGGCSNTQCTFDGTAVNCTVGNLERFGLEFMLVTVKVTATSGKIFDTATVSAFNPDPDTVPDRSSTAVTVVSNR